MPSLIMIWLTFIKEINVLDAFCIHMIFKNNGNLNDLMNII